MKHKSLLLLHTYNTKQTKKTTTTNINHNFCMKIVKNVKYISIKSF